MRRSGLFSAISALESCARQSFTALELQRGELSARTLAGREMAEMIEVGSTHVDVSTAFSAKSIAAAASRVIDLPDLAVNRREFGDARPSRINKGRGANSDAMPCQLAGLPRALP